MWKEKDCELVEWKGASVVDVNVEAVDVANVVRVRVGMKVIVTLGGVHHRL